jgi:hypothetical protein
MTKIKFMLDACQCFLLNQKVGLNSTDLPVNGLHKIYFL